MTDVKEFVTEYIQREYTVPAEVDIMTLNYVEAGYIDSLGMLQFIATIEDEFNVVFSDEDMKSSDIKVVGTLIDMIKNKMEVGYEEY